MMRCIYGLGSISPILLVLACLASSSAFAARGELVVRIVDHDSGQPIAARMHLKNSRNRPVQPKGLIYWKDHFIIDGQATLQLPPGPYSFEVERGPEYRPVIGHFELADDSQDSKQITLRRSIDMAKEGWWSGELHIHRPLNQIERLMRAEDLHIGPVMMWWRGKRFWKSNPAQGAPVVKFDGNRFYSQLAGEDERTGGALMYYNLPEPLPLAEAESEYPSMAAMLKPARAHDNVHIDIEKPFWWDTPIWLASGMVDSIGLANNHIQRSGMLGTEAWGRPRDKTLYPDPRDNGRWTQDIYYHLLNCGLRLPPSAGSASGVLPNPVGYNRVYVHCGDRLTWDGWWDGLRAGRVIVTNGPLLRPRVNGQLPGHVFQAAAGQRIDLDIFLNLTSNTGIDGQDKIEYLEVVKDGRVVAEVRLDEYQRAGGKLPTVEFDASGWMLIRAVTGNPKTYRFGSTGPYYVQIGNQRRISRQSAQFFVDWVHERAGQIKLTDSDQQADVMRYHRAARDYWLKLLNSANAD